jgi:ribosomal protein S18 acetylase RimI-like enzyme
MIKILPVTMLEKSAILPLLRKNPFKPYRGFPGADEKNVISYIYKEINRTIESKENISFIAKDGDNIIGLITFGDLPWDSKLFGQKMGSIRHLIVNPEYKDKIKVADSLISDVVQSAKGKKYEFILRKINTDDITSLHAMETNKFRLVDTLLDYVYDPYKKPFTNLTQPVLTAGASLRLATIEDEAELILIAQQAFKNHFGRYHSDENIPKDKANKVYEEWISSSLKGYADFIIIMEIEGRIAAYSIWRNPTDEELKDKLPVGHYSLGAVHPDYFGMGLFYAITHEGMRRLVTKVKCIEGPTHVNNYPVQRGYAKLGWQIYDAHHSFHLWL